MQVTIMLLFPDDELEALADKNVQSFLYYGRGSPCGMLLNGRVLLPKYSPPLYIFPSPETPTEYHFWSLQFLSMTLLQPVAGVADLNHETLDSPQWVQKRIGMPNIRASPADTPHLPGIRALFDSCSACTVLPRKVVSAIWTSWFGHLEEDFQPKSALSPRLWHSDATRFAKHDIVFEFRDYRGTPFNLRCSAQVFLTSPWSAEGEGTRYAQFVCAKKTDSRFILGMNFFWAALIKMNVTHRDSRPVPGRAHPYVQLAPQRVIHDGQRVGTAWDLGLHKYLSPRQLAEVRDQPEIYADP
ncbi:hypothetical protein K466DRAFT_657130 [Polyporus arcularius HHB13444]|uniref:Uncharacterized protein n=1 Tax=Polyporus arcularius HHB13444 TaxID=1314778 RepID=A0A5C3NPZ5_9APHY|nr:hypothetical protein K466DRAFT_657130 [Polyporus arcularius HHB13444]